MKLLDYIKGNRRGRDAHRIELDAMSDPLLGDAMEGFDKVKGAHGDVLERLDRRIAERTAQAPVRKGLSGRRTERLRNWSVAAAAVVLVCAAGGGLLYLRQNAAPDERILTQDVRKTGETPPEVSMPPVLAGSDSSREEAKQIMQITAPREEKIYEDHSNAARPVISMQEMEASEDIVVSDALFDRACISADSVVADEVTGPPAESRGEVLKIESADRKAAKEAEKGTRMGSLVKFLPVDSAKKQEAEVAAEYEVLEISKLSAAAPTLPADTVMTAAFRKYLIENIIRTFEGERSEGRAVVEFTVDENGRPCGIKVVEETSPKAGQEAKRLVQEGPDWEPSNAVKRITVIF